MHLRGKLVQVELVEVGDSGLGAWKGRVIERLHLLHRTRKAPGVTLAFGR